MANNLNLATPSMIVGIHPFNSRSQKVEKECFTHRIADYLARSGNTFRLLSFTEYHKYRREFLFEDFRKRSAEKMITHTNESERALHSLKGLKALIECSSSPTDWVASLRGSSYDVAEALWVITRILLDGIDEDARGGFSWITVERFIYETTKVKSPRPDNGWDIDSTSDEIRWSILRDVDDFIDLRQNLISVEAAAGYSPVWREALTVKDA